MSQIVGFPQNQYIMVTNCTRFSLTSDGTKEGTQVDNEGRTGSCSNVEGLYITNSRGRQNSASSPTRHPYTIATQRPIFFAGTASRRTFSTGSLLLALTLMCLLIVPEVLALIAPHRDDVVLGGYNVRLRATPDKVKAFAEDSRATIARRAVNEGINGEVFANDLVANVVSSVCGRLF